MNKEHVTLKKIHSYDPFHERADSLDLVWEWAAFDHYGNAVAFAYTKKECLKEARRMGYVPVQ